MIPVVELIRLEESFYCGTFGALKLNKEVFCWTLEPPDRLNERNVSSIPAQQYECRRKLSQRFGATFEVADVPGRINVLFHAGNTVGDTAGCILLASEIGKLKGDRAVLNSGRTFKKFLQIFSGVQAFHLTIREVY